MTKLAINGVDIEAAGSALLGHYAASQPDGLAHPSLLTQTDLTDALVPDAT